METAKAGVIERAISVICKVILWLSTVVIFAILVVNTILRYATGASLQWASEVPELLFPWLVMSGVVLASLHGAHIATTFLMDVVSGTKRRVIATLSWLVVAGMYFTMSFATFRMLEIVHDERTPILQLPGSFTYACVMAGMILMALLAIQSAIHSWREPAPASVGEEAKVPTAHW